MITIFDPVDIELLTVDVWPFDCNTEEVVLKVRVAHGTVLLRVLVDTGNVVEKPVLATAEVADYD